MICLSTAGDKGCHISWAAASLELVVYDVWRGDCFLVLGVGALSWAIVTLNFGNEKLNIYNNRHISTINNMITKALIATAWPPNACSNIHKIGQEIYHPSCSYALLSQSTIGKFIIADRRTMTMLNDLIIIFMRCHLRIMRTPATTHKAKNMVSQTSPNPICAYFLRKTNVGDHGAKNSVKKYNPPTVRSSHPSLYLLRTICLEDFLRRATIVYDRE